MIMAGIEKIYGNRSQYEELYEFLEKNKPEFLNGMIQANKPKDDETIRPVSSFTVKQDEWLYENCDIDFVTDRIEEQYNGQIGS